MLLDHCLQAVNKWRNHCLTLNTVPWLTNNNNYHSLLQQNRIPGKNQTSRQTTSRLRSSPINCHSLFMGTKQKRQLLGPRASLVITPCQFYDHCINPFPFLLCSPTRTQRISRSLLGEGSCFARVSSRRDRIWIFIIVVPCFFFWPISTTTADRHTTPSCVGRGAWACWRLVSCGTILNQFFWRRNEWHCSRRNIS